MLKFDPATRASLNGATTKIQWTQLLSTALGDTRRIRCFRDANASAADPFATGTEFRNVGSTGTITTVAGKVTKLGRIKGTTLSLAADMTTGASVVRITNADGSRWVQGTLGLSVAAQVARGVLEANAVQYDFTVSGNFTDKNGLGITPNFGMCGYRFLPSGTGPAAPALDANAPHTFEVWNWTDPANPVLSGTTTLDRRDDDFVYEDADMASEQGDIAVYQTSVGIMHGTGDVHEFGFTLLASHQGNTEAGNLPLYEVIGAAAVRGTWTTYPQSDTYDVLQHTTYPAPFKVVMKNAAGAVLYTWEMRDGLPINGQPYITGSNLTMPIRPYWNCGMQLPWENTPQKVSSKATKWYAGMTDAAKRPSRAKSHVTVNGVEPMITGGYQGNSYNGLHNMYGSEQWSRAYKDRPSPTPNDPYLSPNFYQNDGSADSGPWRDGWGWEPASFSNHNWYTGPGGPRFDRAPIPSIFALLVSDLNGSRTQGNVPWKTLAQNFTKAYHNHSNHWVTNPNTLQLAKNNDELLNQWGLAKTYYDGHPIFGPKRIDVRSDMRDGENAGHYDKNGRYIWSGWGRDPLHSYGNAGWAALLMNSPRAAIASKWDAFTQMALNGGQSNYRGDYMVRSQAWLWLCFTINWKLASSHRLGITRTQIESLFVNHLESLYQDVYVPVFVNNEQSIFANGIRNLGVPCKHSDNYPVVETQGGELGFYMAGVLALMKQTGLWSVMYAKGGHVKTVMDMQLANMDKYCFDKILDTPSSQHGGGGYQGWGDTNPVPTSWANYSTIYDPFNGSLGLCHNADGSICPDRDVAIHPMAMYPYIRRDYFPEFPNARLAAAIAKFDAELGAVTAYVAAAAGDPNAQRDRDHTYGYPGVAPIKAPTELGPA